MSRRRRALPLALLLLLLLAGGIAVTQVMTPPGDGGHDVARPEHAAVTGAAIDAGRERSRRVRDHVRGGAGAAAELAVADAPQSQDGGEGHGDSQGDAQGKTDEPAADNGAAAGAIPGDDEREAIDGRVVDAATDAAMVGARILVVRRAHGWYGSRTKDDGTFAGQVPRDPGDGSLVEVRIAAPGYETLVVPWSEGPVVARLQALDHVPLPGDVVGVATRADGHVVSGRLLLLTTYDEMGDHHGFWVQADEAGAFRLDGLAAGSWTMRLVGGSAAVDVGVPEGGVTRVNVVAGDAAWPGEMTAEEFERLRSELSAGLPPGATDEQLSDEQRQALAWQRIIAIQDLESRWAGARPARAVVVTGLPKSGAPQYMRAASTSGPNYTWRARVVNGEARFPALTPETWRLVLEVPGEDAGARTVDVTAGSDAQTVAWSPPAAANE